MHHNLFVIILTIAIAIIINVFLKKIKIPTIIGYIIAGVMVSSFLSFDEDFSATLGAFAEFRVVFLMFTIGLEFSLSHLQKMRREVFVYGFLQVFVTGILFALLGYYLLGLVLKTAFVIGFALSLSSTAIVLKILNERNEVHSGYGRVSVGILLFQDLAVIPILLMISIITTKDQAINDMLLALLTSAVIVVVTFFVVGKYVIERFFGWIVVSKSEEIFLVAVLFVVMTASFFVEKMGFSYSLGAFLTGMMLSETKFRYKIEADLIPFRDLLLGVFFVTIGMQIDWHSFVIFGSDIVVFSLLMMAIKALVLFVVLYFFVQKRTVMKATLALSHVGEFALVVFTIAFTRGLITKDENQILIISVIVSMIVAPFLIKNIKKIVDINMSEPFTLR